VSVELFEAGAALGGRARQGTVSGDCLLSSSVLIRLIAMFMGLWCPHAKGTTGCVQLPAC
jgi:hypothetical protein